MHSSITEVSLSLPLQEKAPANKSPCPGALEAPLARAAKACEDVSTRSSSRYSVLVPIKVRNCPSNPCEAGYMCFPAAKENSKILCHTDSKSIKMPTTQRDRRVDNGSMSSSSWQMFGKKCKSQCLVLVKQTCQDVHPNQDELSVPCDNWTYHWHCHTTVLDLCLLICDIAAGRVPFAFPLRSRSWTCRNHVLRKWKHLNNCWNWPAMRSIPDEKRTVEVHLESQRAQTLQSLKSPIPINSWTCIPKCLLQMDVTLQ